MTEGAPRIAAAVIGYRDADALASCLRGLRASRTPDVELLVFDNSEDEQARGRMRAATPPDVRYLAAGENLGYAGAAARLLPLLFGEGREHVILLNQDLQALPGLFEAMAAAADAPGVGLVGVRTVAADRPERVEHVGCRVLWPWLHTSHARPSEETVHLEGSALLVTRRAFESVGNFDKDYFLYFEDIDYSERVRRAGLVGVVSEARIVHAGGRRGTHCAYWTTRNRIRFLRKHGRPRHVPAVLAYTLVYGIPAFAWICRPRMLPGAWAAARGLKDALADAREHGFWLREMRA